MIMRPTIISASRSRPPTTTPIAMLNVFPSGVRRTRAAKPTFNVVAVLYSLVPAAVVGSVVAALLEVPVNQSASII